MNRYLYETHVHTSESSVCAHSTGAQMARAYAAGGYTGIIVSDHFYYGNTVADRSLPWRDWVEQYCLGYEHARAEGEKLGLQVFFAWESTYQGNDFLVYGLDKEWLLAHPEIRDASIAEQYALVRADGGMVIHMQVIGQYLNVSQLFMLGPGNLSVLTVSQQQTVLLPVHTHHAEDVSLIPSGSGADDPACVIKHRFRPP